MISIKAIATASAIAGAAVVCPLCETAVSHLTAQGTNAQAQVADTATVRVHISEMTCGSCPVTARVALRKIPGVLDAKVTLDDSLGVVRYNPRKVKPAEIAARLTQMTGYPARILADAKKAAGRIGG